MVTGAEAVVAVLDGKILRGSKLVVTGRIKAVEKVRP